MVSQRILSKSLQPLTQQGFAELKYTTDKRLRADVLSRTPQTQQGFAEPDSTVALYTTQGLSVEDAESDSTTRYVQGTMTQRRRC